MVGGIGRLAISRLFFIRIIGISRTDKLLLAKTTLSKLQLGLSLRSGLHTVHDVVEVVMPADAAWRVIIYAWQLLTSCLGQIESFSQLVIQRLHAFHLIRRLVLHA